MLFVVFNYIKVVAGNECCNNHSILEQFALKSRKWCLNFLLYVLCDWFRKLMLLSQPIRCKIKPNHDLVTHVFPRFWKMENVLFFVKRQFVILSRDWIETYSSFDWNAQRKENRDTRLSYFREMQNYNSQLSCGTKSWNYCTLKRETTSIFYFLWSYIC